MEPALSVVVPSVNGLADLVPCLRALEDEGRRVALEVLVPERCGGEVRAVLAAEFPLVRVLPVPAATSIPAMRRTAIDAATAPLVAVIEDHVHVPAGWAARASGATASVTAGAVRNGATRTLASWAAFVCEYSDALVPRPAGPAERLPGNNTVYRRDALRAVADVLATDGWEDGVHAAIRAHGGTLVFDPGLEAEHVKHVGAGEYAGQRFQYSRMSAAIRLAGRSWPARAAFGAAALVALPPVLLGRIVARAWSAGRERGRLVAALPLLAGFVCAWGAGEAAGAWFGAGSAPGRVR